MEEMNLTEIIKEVVNEINNSSTLTEQAKKTKISSPTWLMYFVCNTLSDEELEYMGIDIVDVAEEVYCYIDSLKK